jgi:uncharacterized alpha-E superfamily protein
MISRVADHCFWLGRYLERAESTAGTLSVTRNLSLDGDLTPRQAWQPAIVVSGEGPRFVEQYGEAAFGDGEIVQRDLVWEPKNPVCVARSVAAARENARAVREVVSLETWEVLNELHLWMQSPAAEAEYLAERHGFYRRVRQSTQLAMGLMRSTMLHDEPLDFIWLGVMLERAGQTARLLDVHHHAVSARSAHGVLQTELWLSLLRACSGFEPFMKRHQGQVSRGEVAAFLILEPDFPRSVRYTIHSSLKILGEIIGPDARGLPGSKAQARLAALDGWLRGLTARDTLPDQVHALLTRVVTETSIVCDEICADIIQAGDAAAGQQQAQ